MTDNSNTKEPAEHTNSSKIRIARGVMAASSFGLVAVGLAFSAGTGTLSSLGIDSIAAICPLGALESIFGSWAIVPRVLIVLALTAALVLIVGKAFCSWVCPVPHIGNIFSTKKQRERKEAERRQAATASADRWQKGEEPPKRGGVDSRHVVLGGTLLSTALFGFPVFCLICPIGLSFATFILLWRFVQFNEPTWGLLVFPAVILLEVVVLKKWCGRFCPLGALLSLLSKFNHSFVPTVDQDKCLRNTKTGACHACSEACPEFLDPYANLADRPLTECIKCHSCVDACPAKALSMPLGKKAAAQNLPALEDEPATNEA